MKKMKKKYPIGVQNFDEVRIENFLYIDKTKYALQIADEGKYFFLSRPRRFGKSLFVSTLNYLFQGKKELFKGLYIEDKWNWEQTNPVIEISFGNIDHKELGLSVAIKTELRKIAKNYGFELESYTNGAMFRELIETIFATTGRKVVILIDEYDKPIIDFLGKDLATALENQEVLKAFYAILKDADRYLKLVFITGVSKFSRVSIFSDLNNLQDITIDYRFAGICGVTQEELENNFIDELKEYDKNEIQEWYNGYRWDMNVSVYNPFSLLNFFSKRSFRNYWFETGTPTFLINISKQRQMIDFENVMISFNGLDAYEIDRLQLIPLMFQTGYLTIKNYDEATGLLTLGYPNLEVRKSFLEILANSYIQSQEEEQGIVIALQLGNALKIADFEKVKQILNTLFKSIPYTLWQKENEHFYHAIIHLIFKLLGIYVDSEVQTSDGRMDALVRLEKYIYCFEFKLDESADIALQQIQDKGYLTPYSQEGKTCIGIGVNFSRENKKVEEMKWKEFDF
jgi:hypothetical protein